ncbi:MAG: hypothetical protein JWR68_3353 [Polaromonas sp.]|nr:hypothetical protein [Polaromonas sp.]
MRTMLNDTSLEVFKPPVRAPRPSTHCEPEIHDVLAEQTSIDRRQCKVATLNVEAGCRCSAALASKSDISLTTGLTLSVSISPFCYWRGPKQLSGESARSHSKNRNLISASDSSHIDANQWYRLQGPATADHDSTASTKVLMLR